MAVALAKLPAVTNRLWLPSRPQNLITGPIVYAVIVPLLILDLCVSLYHWACFPI
jgi:hypothetical protein